MTERVRKLREEIKADPELMEELRQSEAYIRSGAPGIPLDEMIARKLMCWCCAHGCPCGGCQCPEVPA